MIFPYFVFISKLKQKTVGSQLFFMDSINQQFVIIVKCIVEFYFVFNKKVSGLFMIHKGEMHKSTVVQRKFLVTC